MSDTVMPIRPTALTRLSARPHETIKRNASVASVPIAMTSLPRSRRESLMAEPALLEARLQVIADAECVGHDRQRRVHGPARREEAPVDDVEVVELVRLAV